MNYRNSVGARVTLAFATVIVVFGGAVALSIARLAAFNAVTRRHHQPSVREGRDGDAWEISLFRIRCAAHATCSSWTTRRDPGRNRRLASARWRRESNSRTRWPRWFNQRKARHCCASRSMPTPPPCRSMQDSSARSKPVTSRLRRRLLMQRARPAQLASIRLWRSWASTNGCTFRRGRRSSRLLPQHPESSDRAGARRRGGCLRAQLADHARHQESA